MSSLTVVSGLVNIGRGEIGTSFTRPFDHYKETFAKLLSATKAPMLLYISPDLEDFVWQHRDRENTRIRYVTVDDLRKMPFYEQIQQIRLRPEWSQQKAWLAESTQARLELYNPLVMSKMFWTNDASILNHFNTKYFLWIDGGIANTVHPSLLGEKFEKLVQRYMEDAALFLCFPYEADGEIHGFKASEMNRYAHGSIVNRVARGGLFGGTREQLNALNGLYYKYLNDSLSEGLMGTEECIFTILTYNHSDLCRFEMIGENGLIAPWIEKMLSNPRPTLASKLGVYSVCFNLPNQYRLWIDSIRGTHKAFLKNCSKYVVNNSTDTSTDAEFSELCKFNNIQQTRKPENLGICGARQLCAEMFDTSDHDFMVFFEDDMLLCDESFEGKRCQNGFIRYDSNLFQKCMKIMEKEKLDYLKLCFTEFYGDNHLNWAWVNLPKDKKEVYFPGPQVMGGCNKTKIYHTGSVDGLPYAVGEFHYCNWPVMFTKEGNRKVFLDTKWAHPYEQTWMSHVHQQVAEGKIRTGCLLASVIDHNRVYHYSGSIRKENHS